MPASSIAIIVAALLAIASVGAFKWGLSDNFRADAGPVGSMIIFAAIALAITAVFAAGFAVGRL